MSILEKTPADARRRFRAILPDGLVKKTRGAVRRRLDARSMVTREPEFVVWVRRVILKRKPVLYHFETHIVDHCNLDCRGCGHFSNLCTPALADLTEFESDMQLMSGLFSRVREIHLIGGEPLLHPRVAEFCVSARKAFPKSRIYLRTNGTMLVRMDDGFWKTLAQSKIIILCDTYPINLPIIEIKILGIHNHVKIEWTSPDREFVKVPIDPRGGHDAAASFEQCRSLKNRPLLRDGRLYPCAYVAFADVFRNKFAVGGLKVYPTDWIGIRDEPDPEHVFSFLRNPVHWCSNCDMGNRESYEWGRSNHHVSEWTCAPRPPAQPPTSLAPPGQPG